MLARNLIISIVITGIPANYPCLVHCSERNLNQLSLQCHYLWYT